MVLSLGVAKQGSEPLMEGVEFGGRGADLFRSHEEFLLTSVENHW